MQVGFKILCGPQASRGPLTVHIFLSPNLMGPLCEYYFYHKTTGYNVVCQTIVVDQKQFTNIFVGPLGSVNDFRVVRRSTIYYFLLNFKDYSMQIKVKKVFSLFC
jgi:hypothetical protein